MSAPAVTAEPASGSTSAQRTSARVYVQKFGTFLSNMIMPNIGAIIAWGFFTALFNGSGPFSTKSSLGKNHPGLAHFATEVGSVIDPSIYFLLPILIAYAGGKIVHDVRGGVVGAFATMGVIMPTSGVVTAAATAPTGGGKASIFDWANSGGVAHTAPMFLGAMIMGPLTAWLMKKFDRAVHDKIRPGFEMLVNNFSAGILAAIMAIVGMFTVARAVLKIVEWLGSGVNWLVGHHLLPLTSIFIEPAKVFFLNNAINHGVLTPLGIQQSSVDGKSILFLLEANPGPGLGILLAYMIFGRGAAKASAPGAALVHFFGGIHEIYFPYVLMKPRLLLACIAGGMTGVAVNALLHVGLVAPAAPGSILAIWAQAKGDVFKVTLAVLAATAVSFAVAALILKTDKTADDGDLAAATAEMESRKGKKSAAAGMLAGGAAGASASEAADGHQGPIKNIVFACDAGMGSSAMGASVLRKKVQSAGFDDVSVTNSAIANLTDTYDLVVSHQDLTPRARQRTESAIHVSVDNFMGSPRYDEIVDLLQRTNREGGETAPATATAGPAAAEPAAAATGTDAAPVDRATGTATDRTSGGSNAAAGAAAGAGAGLAAGAAARSGHTSDEAPASASQPVEDAPAGSSPSAEQTPAASAPATEQAPASASQPVDETSASAARPAEETPATATQPAAAAGATSPDDRQGSDAAAATESDSSVLSQRSIVVNGTATDRDGAITEAGRLLVASGAVGEGYVDAMHQRETSVSTYMGNLLAIPHGTNEAKSLIERSAISFVRYPGGIDWNGKEVKFVIGIAGQGNDHMALLGKIAEVFLDKDQVARLEAATTPQEISQVLGNVG